MERTVLETYFRDIKNKTSLLTREQEVELDKILVDLNTRFDKVHRKMNKKEDGLFRAIQEQIELIKTNK